MSPNHGSLGMSAGAEGYAPLRLVGLTDAEMAAIPGGTYNKKKVFSRAQQWLKKNRRRLEKNRPGRYVLINANDLTYAVDRNHDAAAKLYKKKYGPTPPEGRPFLGQQLKAKRRPR
jgi:hypothetical protein